MNVLSKRSGSVAAMVLFGLTALIGASCDHQPSEDDMHKQNGSGTAVDENRLVREYAVADPWIRSALESLGIDTCCGGNTPLGEAVRKTGLDMDLVRKRLREATQTAESGATVERDWRQASLSELANHIEETHHAFLREMLPRISTEFEKVVQAHGENHGDMLRDVREMYRSLREEIEAHLMKEEQILFPYLREMSTALAAGSTLPPMHCGSVSNPIRQMEHEHENAGEALSAMRKRTSGYQLPSDACPTFTALYEDLRKLEADLHEHIFLENSILFPRAADAEKSASEV